MPSSASRFLMRALLTGAVLLLGFAFSTWAATRSQPNIVLILSDDMGYSDLGCYGGEIRTPNLDRLAQGGLRFTQFYNTARCCPTRASLLTGLYPHQAGVGHMTVDNKLDGYRGELNNRCVTIAEALKPAGYRAYAVGKWHIALAVGPDGPKHDWPLQRGFDRYYGTIRGGGSYYDPASLVRDNRMMTVATDTEYPAKNFYYTDAISDHAAQFVQDHARDQRDKPFFMYVAYTAAHWPLHARDEDIRKYRGDYDAGYAPIRQARFERQKKLGLIPSDAKLSPQAGDWGSVTNKEWEARCMEVYAAQVEVMDRGIGRIVEALRQTGQLENTLLMYLQDNGGCAESTGRSGKTPRADRPTLPKLPPDFQHARTRPDQTPDGWPVLSGPVVMPGPHDTFIAYGEAWANVSNTPFREFKHWVHEGGISTPLIVHWPARIKAQGELRRQPGHLVDIMATCLEVAAAKYPSQRNGVPVTPPEGKSLVPAFEDRPIAREALYWEHEGNRAVRIDRWKLVAKGPAGPWELYDLESDRAELRNLAAEEPERVKALTAKWETYANRANVLPWIWKPAYGGKPAAEATRFELKPGDSLEGPSRPDVGGRGITIEVQLEEPGTQGVLLAQGGDVHGYSLYLQDGAMHLAVRNHSRLETVSAQHPSLAQAKSLMAKLKRDGSVEFKADGRVIGEEKLSGPVETLPVAGLQVGRDLQTRVGDYPARFEYDGRIGNIVLTLE